jgi:hypothetical protein
VYSWFHLAPQPDISFFRTSYCCNQCARNHYIVICKFVNCCSIHLNYFVSDVKFIAITFRNYLLFSCFSSLILVSRKTRNWCYLMWAYCKVRNFMLKSYFCFSFILGTLLRLYDCYCLELLLFWYGPLYVRGFQ